MQESKVTQFRKLLKLKEFRKSRLTTPLPKVIKARKAAGVRSLTATRLPASCADASRTALVNHHS